MSRPPRATDLTSAEDSKIRVLLTTESRLTDDGGPSRRALPFRSKGLRMASIVQLRNACRDVGIAISANDCEVV